MAPWHFGTAADSLRWVDVEFMGAGKQTLSELDSRRHSPRDPDLLEGKWAASTEKFTLCVQRGLKDVELQDEVERQATRLRRRVSNSPQSTVSVLCEATPA